MLHHFSELSIWEISHHWHGENPDKTSPKFLPLKVQNTMRALAASSSKALYFRCLDQSLIIEGILKQAQEAADKGEWWRFVQLMGGTTVKRKDHPIKLAKENIKALGKYGEPIGEKICGVQTDSINLPTRLHQWRIEKCTSGADAKRPPGTRACARPDGRICGEAALEFCQ